MLCVTFPAKGIKFGKINLQKTERCSFQKLSTFVFEPKVASKPFSWKFPRPNFDLNSLERFASLSQEMASTLSLKSFQKTEKCLFQTLTTFFFEPKVASKPFSKKLTTSKLWFKEIWTLCVTFPSNGFNFVTQKIAKTWKMLFSNGHNIRFWAQGSFKTIFLDTCYDQIWI